MHPGDLARGCSDPEMTWLLCFVLFVFPSFSTENIAHDMLSWTNVNRVSERIRVVSLLARAERNTRQSDVVRLHLQPPELHVDVRSSPSFRRSAMTGARVT